MNVCFFFSYSEAGAVFAPGAAGTAGCGWSVFAFTAAAAAAASLLVSPGMVSGREISKGGGNSTDETRTVLLTKHCQAQKQTRHPKFQCTCEI